MAMKTGGGDELNSEINVTPMVDVMLVLLIIFMVTAPMMNTGVDLDLPQVTAQKLEDPEGKLVLSITKDRKLFLGGSEVSWTGLGLKLQANERVKKEKMIHIEADASLPYAVVVTAMGVAKDSGVTKVLLLTDPTTNLKLDELEREAAPLTSGARP
jgi:biopolymer transport protein TolR